GAAIAAGGVRYPKQFFNRTAAGMGATLLALACVGLVLPAIHYELARAYTPGAGHRTLETLSEEIAVVLAVTYLLSLFFSLRTHRKHLAGAEGEAEASEPPEWGRATALLVLLAATA